MATRGEMLGGVVTRPCCVGLALRNAERAEISNSSRSRFPGLLCSIARPAWASWDVYLAILSEPVPSPHSFKRRRRKRMTGATVPFLCPLYAPNR